ncbi:MAG: Mov34/MPN/PAD-1 family protein [bacterium]
MIRIRRAAWRAMIEHAERAYPEECCGALIGSVERGSHSVTRAVALENAAANRRLRYSIRPDDLAGTDAAARAEGLQLVGIYHSHPDRAASFSPEDAEGAWPWLSYVVLSLRNGRFEAARSFRAVPPEAR